MVFDRTVKTFNEKLSTCFVLKTYEMNSERGLPYQIVNMLCPEDLRNEFRERSALSNYNTKNMKSLHVQKLKLEHAKKSFLYTAPNAWNSIPKAIRMAETIARFKRVEILPFELKNTIVALICTNPWKTSNKILLTVVHLLFFVVW